MNQPCALQTPTHQVDVKSQIGRIGDRQDASPTSWRDFDRLFLDSELLQVLDAEAAPIFSACEQLFQERMAFIVPPPPRNRFLLFKQESELHRELEVELAMATVLQCKLVLHEEACIVACHRPLRALTEWPCRPRSQCSLQTERWWSNTSQSQEVADDWIRRCRCKPLTRDGPVLPEGTLERVSKRKRNGQSRIPGCRKG